MLGSYNWGNTREGGGVEKKKEKEKENTKVESFLGIMMRIVFCTLYFVLRITYSVLGTQRLGGTGAGA